MIQVITSDEMSSICLVGAEVVHSDKSTVKVLLNSALLVEKDRDRLNSEDGFFLSLNDHEDCKKTASHFIESSVKDGGSKSSLGENQWLIEFSLER